MNRKKVDPLCSEHVSAFHFFHRWTKWERFDVTVLHHLIDTWTGKKIDGSETRSTQHWQRRTCLICGKEQRGRV